MHSNSILFANTAKNARLPLWHGFCPYVNGTRAYVYVRCVGWSCGVGYGWRMEQNALVNPGAIVTKAGPMSKKAKWPPLTGELKNPKYKLLVEYQVNGVEHVSLLKGLTRHSPTEEEPNRQRPLKAGEQLRLEEAAKLLGIRLRHARFIMAQPAVVKELNDQLEAIRSGAKVNALREVIRIAGERGDDSPASRTVQLKAAQMVLGPEASGSERPGVTVNVGLQLSPGVVIRLPADAPVAPLELNAERVEDE